jgi:thiosulfate dehydrogenase (quinone) large subunit
MAQSDGGKTTNKEFNMKNDQNDCTAKSAGVALLRWALGLMFLVGGVTKLFMLKGFVTGYLVPAFANTFLPVWLLTIYGFALPFVEAILGLALILGVCRPTVLFATGLTLISLAFGQMLIQGQAIVANIMVYLLMTAVVLIFQEHDGWTIWCCQSTCGETKAEPDIE